MRATPQHSDTQHGASCAGSSSPATLVPWAYDEVFGIVHHEGCRTCRHYMVHVSDPNLQDSYALVLRQRDEELQRRFMEGFRRGRNTQQEHDSERLREYRGQRDEARTLEAVHKLKLEEANALVAQLRDELLALQIAYDELRSPTPHDWDALDLSDGPEMSGAHSPPASDDEALDPHTPDLWDDDGSQDLGVDSDDDDSEHASSWSGEEESDPGAEVESTVDPQTPVLWDDADESDENSDGDDDYDYDYDYDDDDDESVSTPSDEEKSDSEAEVEVVEEGGSALDCRIATSVSGPALQLNLLSFTTPRDTSDGPYVTPSPQPFKLASPQPSTRSFSPPPLPVLVSVPKKDPLTDIRQQMKLAHDPDKRKILAHIKSLVSKAQQTDPALRTEVQKVLLTEWRRPSPPASPRSGEVIYVDASGVGIGFVSGDRWQAWQWKKTWKQDGRDIQWAEAVAVEMGIRLMIAAGHSGRKVVLYSDNRQVVDAVSGERAIGEVYTSQIVHKIDRLCEKHDIRLEILWVPGEQNPADAPSRLNPIGRESTRFPIHISIPEHLQEFVLPWV